MLVQNQTTFSASHVQAYWAHLDHVVYKNEVFEHRATPEAMAEKQPLFKGSTTCRLLKNSKNGSRKALSLTVDAEWELEVGVVTVHSL